MSAHGFQWPPTSFVIAFAVLLTGSAVPVLTIETLPLFDYPNHLARVHILANWHASSWLQEYYQINWSPLPNLAFDLVATPLAVLLNAEIAGKIFLILTFLLLTGGTALLNYAFSGRWSVHTLLSFLFVYDNNLLFGFVGYLFSLGAFLITFALWILLRDRSSSMRLTLFSAFATSLFFLHLYGLGLYALAVMSYEFSSWFADGRRIDRATMRQWSVTLGQFAPAVVIFFAFSPTSEVVSVSSFGDLFDIQNYWRKCLEFLVVFDLYDRTLDLWTAFTFAAVLGFGLVLGWIRLGPHAFLPMAAFLLAFLFMPRILFSSFAADAKLPLAIFLSAIALSDWRSPLPLLRNMLGAVFVGLVFARLIAVFVTWQDYDELYAEIRAGFERMPEGAKLIAAFSSNGHNFVALRRPSLYHLGNLVVVQRDGFFPSIFAVEGQQPLRLADRYRALADRYRNMGFLSGEASQSSVSHLDDPFDPDVFQDYDYMLVLSSESFEVGLPPALIPWHEGADFCIYRIESHAL